jgi:ATP-dependent RNA helicase DDX41
VATTFINKEVEESALLDLKHLLIEAKQRVPPVRILFAVRSILIRFVVLGGRGYCYIVLVCDVGTRFVDCATNV